MSKNINNNDNLDQLYSIIGSVAGLIEYNMQLSEGEFEQRLSNLANDVSYCLGALSEKKLAEILKVTDIIEVEAQEDKDSIFTIFTATEGARAVKINNEFQNMFGTIFKSRPVLLQDQEIQNRFELYKNNLKTVNEDL